MEQVNISEYNPHWAWEFEQEKLKIAEALEGIVLGIEHIGSTSVPGLGAKPIIDIMAGVSALDEITPVHRVRLERIGYHFVDHPHFPERRFFRRGEWRAGTHHLHVYRHEGEHWNMQLLFRNYLIRHPEALKDYFRLKQNLAQLYPHDRAKYTEAKGSFIRKIIELARAENEN
ncbi:MULTISPECIES: GrpB family protein [Paenibacillus]|uniref:GrpB family protein n=1 Tax=Paenibacillus albilobatus TaxID=2716884 RepID=A0A919XCW6_9BACL|nr:MULTISPECIES: GrpB family protein [Paenibacillus]GIO29836.1 hypothetical protein J2TS6_09770 [Paenibacillus albilobatus]